MPETTKPTIYEALSNVQLALKAPKGQYNKFGHYSYRSCEDILEAVKPLCQANGLVLVISDEVIRFTSKDAIESYEVNDQKGSVSREFVGGDRFYIKATARVTDFAGQSIEVSAYAREGQNRKGMDDSQITGSASSYARKYALNGLFNIDDTKDADTNEQHAQTSQPVHTTTTPSRPATPAARPVAKPTSTTPACPNCGGEMWDNRAKKASGEYKSNRPDFSCKKRGGDPNCDGAIWPEKKFDPKEDVQTMSVAEELAYYDAQQNHDLPAIPFDQDPETESLYAQEGR